MLDRATSEFPDIRLRNRQGRQCGQVLSAILAQMAGASMDEIGFLRVRTPLEPVSLRDLADLDSQEIALMG